MQRGLLDVRRIDSRAMRGRLRDRGGNA
jgi:hypothetical protein